jgi:ribonuclease G
MGYELIANVEPWETRVALLEDGVLTEVFIERGEPIAGNIYKGRVANVLPGMEAAFVDIGLERNAFLHVTDVRAQRLAGEELEEVLGRQPIHERLRVGQEILVQVTKEPMGTKGARVTTYLALPAHYLVLMPTVDYVGVSRRIENEAERRRLRQLAERIKPTKMGLIVRTAAEGVGERELRDDLRYLLQVWNRVMERAQAAKAPALIYQDLRLIRRVVRDLFTEQIDRFVIDSPEEYERLLDFLNSIAPHLKPRVQLYQEKEPIFHRFGIEQELERALRRKVWLKSGGYIVIDRTEALTVIDVNTGKYVGKTDLASTILQTNLEAVGEIVRQIRLRDLGGIILVDFIDMEDEKHQKKVLHALQQAVRRDRTKTHVIDLTSLGLVEMTRKRVYQDLDGTLRMPCPYCEGRGRVFSPETMAARVRRELKRLAYRSPAKVLAVEVHPQVEGLLREGPWINELERASGKTILIRGEEGLHLEHVHIAEVEHPAEVEAARRAGRRTALVWAEGSPEMEEEEEELVRVVGESRADRKMGLLGRLFRRLLGGITKNL